MSAAKLTTAQVSAVLKRAGRRNITDRTAVIRAAFRSPQLAQPPQVTRACASVVRALAAVLATLNEQIMVMESEVDAHFLQHPDAEIILSQPGLGHILGARVLAEFGDDPARYASAKARKNYAATSPITRKSGKKTIVLARYVHNDRLRDALDSQAFSALSASPGARAYYDRQKARGRGLLHDGEALQHGLTLLLLRRRRAVNAGGRADAMRDAGQISAERRVPPARAGIPVDDTVVLALPRRQRDELLDMQELTLVGRPAVPPDPRRHVPRRRVPDRLRSRRVRVHPRLRNAAYLVAPPVDAGNPRNSELTRQPGLDMGGRNCGERRQLRPQRHRVQRPPPVVPCRPGHPGELVMHVILRIARAARTLQPRRDHDLRLVPPARLGAVHLRTVVPGPGHSRPPLRMVDSGGVGSLHDLLNVRSRPSHHAAASSSPARRACLAFSRKEACRTLIDFENDTVTSVYGAGTRARRCASASGRASTALYSTPCSSPPRSDGRGA